jgi:hypothetical protein
LEEMDNERKEMMGFLRSGGMVALALGRKRMSFTFFLLSLGQQEMDKTGEMERGEIWSKKCGENNLDIKK